MINLNLTSLKALGEDDGTHLFGSPMFDKKLAKTKFNKDELFVGQINLRDVKRYDKDDYLPEDGMLYIIYDTFTREYSLFYTQKPPTYFVEGFNTKFDNKRYDHPLEVNFSNPKDSDEEMEECVKMFAEIPESVKAKLSKPDEYLCLFKFLPSVMENLGRNYLLKVKECSCVLIKIKDIDKGKIEKIITINI